MPTRDSEERAWKDYGQAIVTDLYDELLSIGNELVFEYEQVMTDRDDWFLENMSYYGF